MKPGEYTLTIKRGSAVVKVDRMDLIQIDETYDGIAFSFKGGLNVQLTDQFMPTEVKVQLKSSNSIPKGNLTLNLNDYRKPTSIDM